MHLSLTKMLTHFEHELLFVTYYSDLGRCTEWNGDSKGRRTRKTREESKLHTMFMFSNRLLCHYPSYWWFSIFTIANRWMYPHRITLCRCCLRNFSTLFSRVIMIEKDKIPYHHLDKVVFDTLINYLLPNAHRYFSWHNGIPFVWLLFCRHDYMRQ